MARIITRTYNPPDNREVGRFLGPPGLSAYEVWRLLPGNAGLSEEDFIAAITGADARGVEGITVASLPDATTAARRRFEVLDVDTAVWSPTVGNPLNAQSGGGSGECEVRSNGVDWIVIQIF
jgi:hypothetical protein